MSFTYTLKVGKNGKFTKELFIDRRENSKPLAWSSVKIAFEKAMEKPDTVFEHPKAIAGVQGESYSYSLPWRSGVISVPEDAEKKLRGKSVNHGLKRSVAWAINNHLNVILEPTYEEKAI